MHIGFLLPEYPHDQIKTACAGIGTSSKNIVEGILREKHKVSIFIYGQECNEIIKEGNLTIHKIAKSEFKYLGFYFYRRKINSYLNKVILKENIELLEAPDWTGITAFMKFNIPHVIRLHGSDTFFCHLEKRKQKRKNYFFEKSAYKNCNAVIGVSKYVLDVSQELFKTRKKGLVVPNGLIVKNEVSKKNPEIKENAVLYFGSIIRKKGVLELAKIFNNLIIKKPDTKLQILGRDVEDYKTRKSTLKLFIDLLSEEAKSNFEYLGVLPYKDLNEVVLKSSVCVFPSLAESFGMVTIEAMFLKKAVVSTNYPWAKEIIINEEIGSIEDPVNHESFAQKILYLLENEDVRLEMGEKAHEHIVSEFSMTSITDRNISYYKKVLNNEI